MNTAQPFDPGETLTLTLELDATDALEEPESHPVAVVSGVANRIAALEMLLYPTGDSLLGSVFGSLGGAVDVVPRGSVPVVLLVCGGRDASYLCSLPVLELKSRLSRPHCIRSGPK